MSSTCPTFKKLHPARLNPPSSSVSVEGHSKRDVNREGMCQILGEDTSPQRFLASGGVFSSKPQVQQSLHGCGKTYITLDSSWRLAGFSMLQLQHWLKSVWFLTTHQRTTSAAKKKIKQKDLTSNQGFKSSPCDRHGWRTGSLSHSAHCLSQPQRLGTCSQHGCTPRTPPAKCGLRSPSKWAMI